MKKILIVIVVIICLVGILAIAESLMKKSTNTNIKDETISTSSLNTVSENVPSAVTSEIASASQTNSASTEVKEEVKQPVKEPVKATTSAPVVSTTSDKKDEVKPIEKPPVEVDTGDNFTLTDINGKTVKLSDYRGKKVFVNFWATWCGPCTMEMPHIQKVFETYPDIQILTINSSDAISKIDSFMKENNYTFKVLIDSTGEVSDRYGVNAIPTSILYDEKGKVINKIVGSMSEDMMLKFLKIN